MATGRDLGDWWEEARDEGKPLVLTWTGANESSRKFKRGIRLYKTTWTNPQPDVAIESIEFEAMDKQTIPFLIAITVE